MRFKLGALPRRTALRLRGFCGPFPQQTRSSARHFASSTPLGIKDGSTQNKDHFRSRLLTALRNTKTDWSPIPVGVGIAFLGAFQFYRVRERERKRQDQEDLQSNEDGGSPEDGHGRPKKRKRIRPSGPWLDLLLPFSYLHFTNCGPSRQIQVMSTLPLKAVSRLWGRFNELEIPYYLRVPGFKLYSWIFGVK